MSDQLESMDALVTRVLRDDLSRALGPSRVLQLQLVVAGKAWRAQALLEALAKREA